MKRIITAAALAVIFATIAACGGDGQDAPQENLHPVLSNHIYLQIQEDREYILLWEDFSKVNPSDRINALHQGGYEIEHTTRNSFGRFILIFRKIPHPEESVPPNGTTVTN